MTRQPISICDIVTVTAMIILFMLAHVPLIVKCNVAAAVMIPIIWVIISPHCFLVHDMDFFSQWLVSGRLEFSGQGRWFTDKPINQWIQVMCHFVNWCSVFSSALYWFVPPVCSDNSAVNWWAALCSDVPCALMIQPWTDEPHCALMFHLHWCASVKLCRLVHWFSRVQPNLWG